MFRRGSGGPGGNLVVPMVAVVALIAPSIRCLAQSPSSLPVIQPKVVELGEYRDETTLTGVFTPWYAVFSPSRSLVAIATNRDVRIWNPSTQSSHVVFDGFSDEVVWSPAGDAIAFNYEDDRGDDVWKLRLNPVTGQAIGKPERASPNPRNQYSPQFSPDGKSIAFSRQDSGQRSSIVSVRADGRAERVLASGYGLRNLRWAADGSAIYYVQQDSANPKATLKRVPATGGTPQLVQEFTANERAPVLSADNRVVLLSEDVVDRHEELRIGDLTGRALASLVIPAGVSANWSGERHQVGLRREQGRKLRIINVADGTSRELIDSTADVQAVAWFDDSRRFAAIVFYNDSGMLVTMNADGTGLQKLALTSKPARPRNLHAPPVENFRLSPSGQYAVYLAGSAGLGGTTLELVDLTTGVQRTLTSAQNVQQPFWHPDSRAIRYMRMTRVATTDPRWLSANDVSLDGVDAFVRGFPRPQYPNAAWMMGLNHVGVFNGNAYAIARLDSGPDVALLRARIRSPGAISADGSTVAVTPGVTGSDHRGRQVILLSIPDGTQRTLDLPFTEAGCGPFSPDGRYLYCKGRETDSDPQTLYEVPVDGSKARLVTSSNSREVRGAIALSPDGKWMLETVAGARRTAFVSLDFTEGLSRLFTTPEKR